jgi:phosphatidate cytidylyltransferase
MRCARSAIKLGRRSLLADRARVALLLFPVLVTWISDVCAYAIGHLFGRRKLAPAISPGKTVEGAVVAVAGAAVAGAPLAIVLREQFVIGIQPWPGAAAGALFSVVEQLGDLSKSVVKREAGVKDSGRLFPGHGGIVDRLDSLFFTLPVAYLLFRVWLA